MYNFKAIETLAINWNELINFFYSSKKFAMACSYPQNDIGLRKKEK